MSIGLLSTQETIRGFFGEEPVLAATIRLTKGCNLRCPHCYVSAAQPLKNELTTNEIKSVVDQLKQLKAFYVFYTGGEPFTRRDIVEILHYTDEKKIGISISTNGTFITPELLKKIKDIPFTLFQISLDGTKEIHDAIRGSGMWERAIRAITLARRILKKNIGIGTVITKKNSEIIDKILTEGAHAGADTFTLLCLIVTGRANDSQNPTPKEFNRSVHRAFTQYRLLQSKLKVAKDTTIPPALIPRRWREKGIYLNFAPCSFPYYLGINADGAVAPCDGLFNEPEMIVGNIREKSLKEMWKQSKLLKELRRINPSDLRGVCEKCVFKNYCNGGCRAHAYIKYRDFTMPDPVCQTAYEAGYFPKDCLQ